MGGIAVLLVVAGIGAWRLIDRPTPSAVIPQSFAGRWTGEGRAGDGSAAGFDARLVEGLHTSRLESGNSACYGGSLTVTEATDSKLTMRFTPAPSGCTPWTVVFTHNPISDNQLVMSVNPDSGADHESPFEIPLTRQG